MKFSEKFDIIMSSFRTTGLLIFVALGVLFFCLSRYYSAQSNGVNDLGNAVDYVQDMHHHHEHPDKNVNGEAEVSESVEALGSYKAELKKYCSDGSEKNREAMWQAREIYEKSLEGLTFAEVPLDLDGVGYGVGDDHCDTSLQY